MTLTYTGKQTILARPSVTHCIRMSFKAFLYSCLFEPGDWLHGVPHPVERLLHEQLRVVLIQRPDVNKRLRDLRLRGHPLQRGLVRRTVFELLVEGLGLGEDRSLWQAVVSPFAEGQASPEASLDEDVVVLHLDLLNSFPELP